MSFVIRDARRGDGDGIARAWLSAGEYYADLDPEHFQLPESRGLAELFEGGIGRGGDDTLELVAELDGRVVGWLFARLERPHENAPSQFVREQSWNRLAVDALVVDRPVWRRGMGTALLEVAETWARDRGAEVVRLDTWADSPVSVPSTSAWATSAVHRLPEASGTWVASTGDAAADFASFPSVFGGSPSGTHLRQSVSPPCDPPDLRPVTTRDLAKVLIG